MNKPDLNTYIRPVDRAYLGKVIAPIPKATFCCLCGCDPKKLPEDDTRQFMGSDYGMICSSCIKACVSYLRDLADHLKSGAA